MMQNQRTIQQSKARTVNTQQTFPSQMNYQSEPQNMQQTLKRPGFDQQFACIYEQIISHQYFSKITKHEKIRINKWLTKLSNISTNDLWKKNRNNYIKLIRLMFDCEIIIAPFLMMPPERDLHKLTPHEINVIIDQVDKLIDERDLKIVMSKNSNQGKVNKVQWTQESAYIDHHNSSLQKYKDTQNDCKRTYASSSVTANYSKLTQNNISNSHIPPKHPSTTKNKFIQKQTVNQSNNFPKRSMRDDRVDGNKYFPKKQRFDTFETQQMGQQEYVTMMENSSMQRLSPVFEKDCYNLKGHDEIDFQGQSREAINILKCGFRLLQKIPLESLESSSLQQMQTFRRILSQNEFLKCQFEKENMFIEELTNRGTNRSDKALQDINGFNNTQKSKGTQKKRKLTLCSQPTNKQ